MLATPLTTDDLDEIGCSFGDQPPSVAGELVDAVDRGLVADQADTGYALVLAAEITERDGDLQAAEALAARAVEAYRTYGDPDYGFPQAFYARLLMRLGREDDAMAELTALRPLLLKKIDAASYVAGTLEQCGYAALAEQWVTEALVTALQRREDVQGQRGQPAYEQAATVAFTLAQYRHRLRRELDLPHDAHDHLADRLMNVMEDGRNGGPQEYDAIGLLFWPQPELERLLQRWPVLAEKYGHTWDEYRTTVQRTMVQFSESGHPRLGLLAGAVDELATYAERNGGAPADLLILEGYAQHLEEHPRDIPWPPGRNDPCWCGSPQKYKKCCLSRART